MSPFIVVLLILQVVRKLGLRCAKAQANSLVELNDLVGSVGEIRLTCAPHLRGVVRLRVRGSVIDCPAYSCDPRPLYRGERVLVMNREHLDVWVTALAPDPS
jgi:hypothetical protein